MDVYLLGIILSSLVLGVPYYLICRTIDEYILDKEDKDDEVT